MLRLNIPAMEELLTQENQETIRQDASIDEIIDSYKAYLEKEGNQGNVTASLRSYFLEIGIPALSALRIGGTFLRELNEHFSSLQSGAAGK